MYQTFYVYDWNAYSTKFCYDEFDVIETHEKIIDCLYSGDIIIGRVLNVVLWFLTVSRSPHISSTVAHPYIICLIRSPFFIVAIARSGRLVFNFLRISSSLRHVIAPEKIFLITKQTCIKRSTFMIGTHTAPNSGSYTRLLLSIEIECRLYHTASYIRLWAS